MLNKDLTPFMQNNSGSEQAKERLCCQGVRLMVCMSDENADVTDVITSNRKFDVSLDGHFCLTQRMNALFWLMLYELAESVHWKRENTNFRLLPVLQCTRCLRSLIINETREFLQRTFFYSKSADPASSHSTKMSYTSPTFKWREFATRLRATSQGFKVLLSRTRISS